MIRLIPQKDEATSIVAGVILFMIMVLNKGNFLFVSYHSWIMEHKTKLEALFTTGTENDTYATI